MARNVFVALVGAGLAEERGGAERRQESEAVPNREGVASGSATASFFLAYKKMSARISHGFKKSNSSAAG